MATSGSFLTTAITGGGRRGRLRFSWTSTSSTANNTSSISWTLKGVQELAGWQNAEYFYVVVDGTRYTSDARRQLTEGLTVLSGTTVVTHNPTGDRSFTASAGGAIYNYGTANSTGSGTYTLNTIPRASSIGTISGNQIGGSITVNISRASTSFTHRVYYHLPGQEWQEVATAATTSSTFTLPGSVLSFIPNATSGQLRIMIRTYSGSTRIGGDITKYHTVSVPTSTFTAPTSFTMGNAFAVSISRVGSLTHWVELYDGNTRIYSSGNTIGTSDSVNVALSTLAARSPNAMSKVFRVSVATYNGSALIGSSSKNITANVPTGLKPTFSALTVSENVSTVASLVGAYVQTKSKLNLAITSASGIHGSTIKSYNITGVGHNVNSSSTVTGLLSVSGNQTIKGTVIDSRGQSFERSVVVNILPYTAPTLSGLSFRRTLPDKTEAPLGDNATVRATVKVQSLIVNGVQKNSIKYNVQSAKSGGSFADKANTTSTDLTKSYSDVWVGYSVDHAYNFRVRVGDVFGFGGWSVGIVPTGVVTQQWGSKTTSFGKMIDNTGYNVQVGTGGIHSEGPIVDKNGNQMMGFRAVSGDLNTITTAGSYRLGGGHANGFPGHDWSQLLVIYGGGDTIIQLGFPYNADAIYRRSGNPSNVGGSGSWRPWTQVSMVGHTHPASDITSGTFADARIPNLNASKITAGTIADARLPAKAKPTDFVVEQGSNYTKWNSGKVEQWGKTKTSTVNVATNHSLPVKLVSDATTQIMLTANRAGGYIGITAQAQALTSSLQGFNYVLSHGSATLTASADYYIVGRWK